MHSFQLGFQVIQIFWTNCENFGILNVRKWLLFQLIQVLIFSMLIFERVQIYQKIRFFQLIQNFWKTLTFGNLQIFQKIRFCQVVQNFWKVGKTLTSRDFLKLPSFATIYLIFWMVINFERVYIFQKWTGIPVDPFNPA